MGEQDESAEQDMLNAAVQAYDSGDFIAAERILSPLVEQGHPTAMFNLGLIRNSGGDREAAVELWKRAYSGGSRDAANALGIDAFDRGNTLYARAVWFSAAKVGHVASAENLVASCRDDPSEDALSWVKRVAGLGNENALLELARRLLGSGSRDEAKAIWDDLASSGNRAALHNLGVMASEVGQEAAALSWWEQAAQAGHPGSMYALGVYAVGRGDLGVAREWFSRSIEAGGGDLAEAALSDLEAGGES